jgi:hypothetical protein
MWMNRYYYYVRDERGSTIESSRVPVTFPKGTYVVPLFKLTQKG